MTAAETGVFWSRVRFTRRCWLWRGRTSKHTSYGRMRVGGRVVYAHRISQELAHGPIPVGLFVCHSCDTPRCVRPSHLFLGTARDNSVDCWSKFRHPRATAKLDPADIPVILAAARKGWKPLALAVRFDVSKRTIYRVIAGDTFKPWQPEARAARA